MASIISQINWVANGERADSVTINRPLLEFITKYEVGDISLGTDSITTKIDSSIITAASLSDYDLIAYSTAGVLEKADMNNKGRVLGIIVNNGSKTDVYTSGYIDPSFLLPAPTQAQEKYYLNEALGSEGLLTNVSTGSNLYIGRTVEVQSGVYMFLLEIGTNSTINSVTVNFGALVDGDLITYESSTDTFINKNDIDGGLY